MASIEERLVELIKLAAIESDNGDQNSNTNSSSNTNDKIERLYRIKELALTHGLLNNFFQDILSQICVLTFNPEGTSLVRAGQSGLEVWTKSDEGNIANIWTCRAARNVEFLKYSPDGTLFCSAAKQDRRVKVWYQVGDKRFSYVYLNHPMPVTGLEWRRTSNSFDVVKTFITASRAIPNVLITTCQDKQARIWIQTLPNISRGEALAHFHLAALFEAENAHWVNNKESLLQDLLTRALKGDDPASLVDQFDRILESTLKEWRCMTDIVFSIEKLDGALNFWQVKYLDGEENGLYRQIQVTRSTCLEKVLPLHDATTLSSNVTTYSQNGEQTNIFMLTQHLSGTLGLWKLNLDKGVDLVTRITGLPISPMWLKDGVLIVNYDDDDEHLTTTWIPDGNEPSELEEIKTFDAEKNLYRASRLSANIKILPQYHLKQLVELLAFGKLQRVKAILNHLVNCLAASYKEERKSHRSRTLSIVTQSQLSFYDSIDEDNPKQEQPLVQEIELDYVEVTSIKPLSLHLLFESDVEKPSTNDNKTHHAHEEFSATFESFMHSRSQIEETLDEVLGKSTLETISKQKQLEKLANEEQGKGYLTSFNPRKAKMLTKILTHTLLPGLTKVDQMHLLALADAVAFFDASPDDLNDLQEEEESSSGAAAGGMSIVATNIAIDSLDDRGLRFLTAMRQYVYLSKYLPLKQRNDLLESGIGNQNLVWAFHSETQEELIGLIPCVQRNKPNWPELREFGIGWWVKKLEVMRKLIEKVAQSAYQANQDPLDAALFYLALKKKTLVCALLRRVNCDKRLLKLFEQDFNDPINRKKALKNAYALLGLHRFEHAAAFFLLAGSIWDAVEVCINNLNDVQLAMVLIRLYDNDANVPNNLKRLLFTEILGSNVPIESTSPPATSPTSQLPSTLATTTTTTLATDATKSNNGAQNSKYSYDPKRAHKDPFLRSMAFWKLGDYLSAVHTLLEGEVGDFSVDAGVFNFYRFLKDQPLVMKHKRQLMEEFEIKRRTSLLDEDEVHFHRARSLSSGQISPEDLINARQSTTGGGAGTIKQSSTEYEVLNETTSLVDKYSDEAVLRKERRLFFTTAQNYLDSGCPLLALEVLCSEDHLNMSRAQRMKFVACLHILLNELNTLAQDHTHQTSQQDGAGERENNSVSAVASGGGGGGGGCTNFNEIFNEWLGKNIEALREFCSYSDSEEPILRTMLTYCSLNIAAEESLNTVRQELLDKLSHFSSSSSPSSPAPSSSSTQSPPSSSSSEIHHQASAATATPAQAGTGAAAAANSVTVAT